MIYLFKKIKRKVKKRKRTKGRGKEGREKRGEDRENQKGCSFNCTMSKVNNIKIIKALASALNPI